MAEQWYWKHRREMHGPVTTEELLQLAASHRLTAHDQIKVGESGNWCRAGDVEGLFPSAATPPQTATSETSAAAADLLANVHRQQLQLAGGSSPNNRARWRVPVGVVRQFCQTCLEWSGDVLGVLLGVLIRPGVRWGLAATLIVAGIAGVAYTWNQRQTLHQRACDSLVQIRQELTSLRTRNASPSEWAAATHKAEAQREAIVRELERASRPSDPVVLDLLWASRDYLPQILGQASTPPEAAVSRFELHLTRAKRLLARRYQRQSQRQSADPVDWTMVSIVIVDGLILLGGGVFVLRRR